MVTHALDILASSFFLPKHSNYPVYANQTQLIIHSWIFNWNNSRDVSTHRRQHTSWSRDVKTSIAHGCRFLVLQLHIVFVIFWNISICMFLNQFEWKYMTLNKLKLGQSLFAFSKIYSINWNLKLNMLAFNGLVAWKSCHRCGRNSIGNGFTFANFNKREEREGGTDREISAYKFLNSTTIELNGYAITRLNVTDLSDTLNYNMVQRHSCDRHHDNDVQITERERICIITNHIDIIVNTTYYSNIWINSWCLRPRVNLATFHVCFTSKELIKPT